MGRHLNDWCLSQEGGSLNHDRFRSWFKGVLGGLGAWRLGEESENNSAGSVSGVKGCCSEFAQ